MRFMSEPIHNPWGLYDRLIAGVPSDVQVRRACLGASWTYVEAECGMGVAMTCSGGGRPTTAEPLVGQSLRSVAALAKSWNWGGGDLWRRRPQRLVFSARAARPHGRHL